MLLVEQLGALLWAFGFWLGEILKWLEDFSDGMYEKANAATLELHGLLDLTGVVEQDLMNTFNAFRNLSRYQFIENKISEGDELIGLSKEGTSVPVGVPAQSYEKDILPRYKEALSHGLSSYRHHLQKANAITSCVPFSKFGTASGPLPHIIGSEEYLHDNRCGLVTGDFTLGTASFDLRHALEPEAVGSSSGGSHAKLSADLFGIDQDSSGKEVEPLVSAALDFKAMLEAALLSPYRYYDESLTLPDAVGNQDSDVKENNANLGHISSTAPGTSAIAKSQISQQSTGTEDSNVHVVDESVAFFQRTENSAHKLCSGLLSESLFDTEEGFSPSSQMLCAQIPASTEGSGSSSGLSFQENYVNSSRNENFVCEQLPILGNGGEGFPSPQKTKPLTSFTSNDADNEIDSSNLCSSSKVTSGHSVEENKSVSYTSQNIDKGLPLTSMVLSDDISVGDGTCLSEELSNPVSSLSSVYSESSYWRSCTETSSSSVKKAMPIINDIPMREDPVFSTVVFVPPEPGSSFCSAADSRCRDVDACLDEEDGRSNGSAIEENNKMRESCISAEMLHEQSDEAEATGGPTIVISNSSAAVAGYHDCLDPVVAEGH